MPAGRIDTIMEILDDAFNPYYITFWWNDTIDYIDDDAFYDPISWSYFVDQIKFENAHSDGIDIYIGDDDWDTQNGGAKAVQTIQYTSIAFIGTIRDSGWIASATNIVAHELGHSLSLDHTFGGQLPEYADGTDCEIRGDKLCDTPGSKLGIGVDFKASPPPNCEYQGSETDPNSQPYDPMVENYMEYSPPDCMDTFTDEQVDKMRTAMEEANYLSGIVTSAIFGEITYTGGSQNLVTVNFVPNETSTTTIQALGCDDFDWTKTSGSAIYWGTNNNGTELDLELSENGSISFSVSYESFCFGDASLTFVHSGGWFSSYPNPTSDCFYIEADEDFEYTFTDAFGEDHRIDIKPVINTVHVYDQNGNLVKIQTNALNTKSAEVCLSGTKPGLYFVEVNRGQELRYNTTIFKS